MHILLTRPLEDNREMILKFKSLGHEVTHMPLINIEGVKYEDLNFSDFKGIIFTSANAIKFLDTKLIDKKINCFCVGSATESKAKSIGFQNIFAADGNVNNLKELILQNFNFSDGKLLYVSGEIIFNDLDYKTEALLSGKISHKNFNNWNLDLNVNSSNILLINKKFERKAIFYGKSFLDGKIQLLGPLQRILVSVLLLTLSVSFFKLRLSTFIFSIDVVDFLYWAI